MEYNHSTGLFYKGGDEAPEILGNTQSGKQVLAGSAEKYSMDFDEEDHRDAQKIHQQRVAKLHSRARASMLRGGKFNHKLLSSLSDQASHHSNQADYHSEAAGTIEKSNYESTGLLSKSMVDSLVAVLAPEFDPEPWHTADLALEKGRGPDKKKRKRRGEGGAEESKPFPGQSSGVDRNSPRYRGYSDQVLGNKNRVVEMPKTPKEPPKTTVLEHDLPPEHYSTPNVRKYKLILRKLGQKAVGHITYNRHDDTIHVISKEGANLVNSLIKPRQNGAA